MILRETILKVVDNSGARYVRCIGGSSKNSFSIGDNIVVSVQSSQKKQIKKGGVYHAIIVSTKKAIYRDSGEIIRFQYSGVVLVDDKGVPLGTRIFGPIAKELRKKNHLKILALASQVV